MAFNELRAIATFAKAAELGSLRKAAAAQGMTPQAASQSLAQLEAHLGVRLFHRTTRRSSLTEEGREFLAATAVGLNSLQQALLNVRSGREEMAGTLRVVAPRSTMLQVLAPVLQEFFALHPGISPDVQLDDRIGNWVEDRVDVGFRIGTSPDGSVVARRLLPLQLVVCAAPRYVARHGAPQTIDDLARHRCSGFRRPDATVTRPWDFRIGDEIVSQAVPAVFTTNDLDLEAQAVVGGEVIGQLDGFTATPLVRSGALVPILPQHMTDHHGLYVYYGSRVALPTRVRAFIDLAVERLAGNSEFFLAPSELGLPSQAPQGRRKA